MGSCLHRISTSHRLRGLSLFFPLAQAFWVNLLACCQSLERIRSPRNTVNRRRIPKHRLGDRRRCSCFFMGSLTIWYDGISFAECRLSADSLFRATGLVFPAILMARLNTTGSNTQHNKATQFSQLTILELVTRKRPIQSPKSNSHSKRPSSTRSLRCCELAS